MSTFPATHVTLAELTRERSGRAPFSIPRATLGERVRFAALVPINFILQLACVRFASFLALFERLTPGFLDWAGKWRARTAFYRAARVVPAYR